MNLIKISLLYVTTFIFTVISAYVFKTDKNIILQIVLTLINSLILLVGIKYLKISKKYINIFFLIITITLLLLSIDKEYFISSYYQTTSELILPISMLSILNLIILPFSYIFTILIELNISNLTLVIVSLYIIILYIIIYKKDK